MINNTNKDIEFGDVFSIADAYHIPASVTIELCTNCNLKCRHCYIPEHNNVGYSYEMVVNIFKQLRKLGTYELVFTGGEIFLKKEIESIIRLARSMGFDVVLFSNATLITEKIAKMLGELYIANFSTSIYSLKDKIHDSITAVPGSLNKTLEGIKLLRKYNVPIEIKTMVMKSNMNEINEINQFCKKNDFNFVASPFLFPKSDKDTSPIEMRLSRDELIKVLPLINEVIQFEPQTRKNSDFMCSSIQHSFGIDAEGNVMPCNAMFYSVGNVYESMIKDIWESKELRNIQNLHFSDLEECKNCENASYCIRCAGIALSETGNLCSKLSYACVVANARKAVIEGR